MLEVRARGNEEPANQDEIDQTSQEQASGTEPRVRELREWFQPGKDGEGDALKVILRNPRTHALVEFHERTSRFGLLFFFTGRKTRTCVPRVG